MHGAWPNSFQWQFNFQRFALLALVCLVFSGAAGASVGSCRCCFKALVGISWWRKGLWVPQLVLPTHPTGLMSLGEEESLTLGCRDKEASCTSLRAIAGFLPQAQPDHPPRKLLGGRGRLWGRRIPPWWLMPGWTAHDPPCQRESYHQTDSHFLRGGNEPIWAAFSC